MNSPSFVYERRYWKEGHQVIGIDEVGRGALAGPLTLGAVCFDPHTNMRTISRLGINDSKVVPATKRKTLSTAIMTHAYAFSTASCSVEYINTHGITGATVLLIQTLVDTLRIQLHTAPAITIFIDGILRPKLQGIADTSVVNIIDGDAKSISIAAASIIAKVDRDNQMIILSKNYPGYGWNQNKGYGTRLHREALHVFGPTPLHRTLFLRNIVKTRNAPIF